MSNDDNQNQLFAQWAQKNLSALGHLMFYKKEASNNFYQDRINSHKSTIKKLEKFLEEVKSIIKLIKKEISRFQEIPDVDYLCYDDMETILLMRQYAFIEQLICEHSISIATRKYGYLVDLKKNAKIILSLFQDSINPQKESNETKSNDSNSRSILPENQICEIDDFIIIDYRKCDINDLEKQLKYLIPFKQRMYTKIHKRKKALWATNYQQFLSKLVNEAKSHLITELSYFKPLESEISLSRCLFCYKSPFKSEIDKFIDQFSSLPTKTESTSRSAISKATQEFISGLIDECCKLVGPSYDRMTSSDKSICLLIFFRCLFNRCYERYGYDLCDFKADAEKRIKMEKISKVPAHYFPIPWNLIKDAKLVEKNNDDSNSEDQNESVTVSEYIKIEKDCSIGKLFEKMNNFEIAADSLVNSILEPNPIDALFCIHFALIGINKGAFANFKDNVISNESQNSKNQNYEMKQLLCFDDMFALMLGTLLGSEKPDIFFVADMIEKFAPKMSLSPSFDFALANVEGLASHCINFNLEKCYEELNKEDQEKI